MDEYIFSIMKRYNYLLGEIEASYHELSLKLGLSDSAMKILYTICDSGDCCLLQDICRRSGLSKQTINSAVRKLEAEGMIYLKMAGSKNKKVCLTDKGNHLAERTARQVLEMENEIFASWPPEDVQKNLELTEKFLLSFQEKIKHI